MRTTLSIDEDVLLAIKERARREKRSAGAVLSELAREALTRRSRDNANTTDSRYGFMPLPHRGPPVTNILIDQLREDEPE
ncbi:MAG: antitoxin [Acidimicrobiia bacterium]|nr:antitoxin [Acidimicrobiia bacterium]